MDTRGTEHVRGDVDAGAEAGPEAEAGPGPDAGAEPGPDADAGPGAGAEAGPEADAGPEAGPGAEPGPDADADAGPGAGAGPEADAGAEPEAGPGTGPEANAGAGAGTEPEAGPGTGTGPEANAGAGPGAGAEAGTGAGADPATPHHPALWPRLATWASALLLIAPAIVLACRAIGVDAVTPIPQLLAFLPWLLVPAGCALLLALLARRPVLIAFALALTAVNAWFLQPYAPYAPYEADGAGTPRAPVLAQLRVLAANVEFGRGTPDLIAAVRREKPDLVFVPECDYGCARSLAAELPTATYPYRKVIEAQGPEGSAILSTYPLRPADGIPSTLAMPGAVAVVHGREVRIQLAHPLPPVPRMVGKWRSELEAIRAYAAKAEGPTLIAGDFNASQDHAAFRRVLDAGSGLRDSAALAGAARTPTWPAKTAPVLGTQIDHVLVSREFGVRGVRFLDLADTDHRAVLADLDLHGK